MLITLILFATCRRPEAPEKVYQRIWSTYVSGNLPMALHAAAEEFRRWQNQPSSPWHWKFRLLQAEALLGEGRIADAAELLNESVPPLPQSQELEARRRIDLADAAYRSGNARGANRQLDDVPAALADPDLQIRIKIQRGANLLRLGQGEAAERAFQEASRMAAAQGNLYRQAMALNNLSLCRRRQSQYEQAIDLATRALATARLQGARKVEAEAHGNLGAYYSYLGDLDRASEHEQESVRILETIDARLNLMIALGELGLLYDRQEDTQRAITNYERAYEIARDLKHSEVERFASNLSVTLIKASQWEAAAIWNQRALDLAKKSDRPASLSYIERNAAMIAYGRGHPDEAATICRDLLRDPQADATVQWEAHWVLGRISAGGKHFDQANREFEAALASIDGNRQYLRNAYFKITLLSRFIEFYREYVDALVHQNQDGKALRVVESSRARVLAERLGSKGVPARIAEVPALQRLAKSNNISLLSYWLAPARSFAWLITGSGVRRFDLPPQAEIEKLVASYRQVVEHSLVDPLAARDAASAKLWDALLAPIAPLIPKGSRVIVVPDGILHRLNLETLPVPADSSPAHYWVEDVEVAVAPSLTIAAAGPPPTGHRDPSLLLLGAPDYTGSEYQPLEQAAVEVRDIQSQFAGATQAVYAGPQAYPAKYREAEPARFSLIHFAAHAEANRETPLESAVILSRQGDQNKLYAREVIDIPIQADLVTISGCRSAGIRAYAGEGLIGFAWAFLQAGARSVVAGLWEVSDDATQQLMHQLYCNIAAHRDPVGALHDAKLELLRGDPRYRKPFYWAPFQVYVRSAAR